MPRFCSDESCTKRPCFNIQGDNKSKFCKTHASPEMINITKQTCADINCSKYPCFNHADKTKGAYCSKHGFELGMIDVRNKRCKIDGCEKVGPSFNYKDEKKGLYCKYHAYPDMVDVMHKTCIHGTQRGKCRYCDGVAYEKYLKTVTCNQKDCSKHPCFNYKGEKKGLYCAKHGFEFGMIDVRSRRCKQEGCSIISPCFNKEGEKKGVYCKYHSSPDMVDVKNKRCTEHGTILGQCKYCGGASYEKYLKIVTCKTIGCEIFKNNRKYKGYCVKCFMRAYPNEPVSRNYKIKELHVVDAVQKEFPNLSWVCDKRYDFAPTECGSRRRPDMFCHFGKYVVIIEVDENQHTGYESSCENKRLCELYQDFNYAPLVFIRFNPDSYIGEKYGKNVTSCFGYDKKGICTLKKSKTIEWNTRLNLLYETIHKYGVVQDDSVITKSITTCNLWYDQMVS
jgi:hypothetical protein